MAWVIALKANVFWWARFKLTLLYVLIITVIVSLFSILFYYTILDAIEANLAQSLADPFFQVVIFRDVSERARNLIIIADGLILILSAILSYFLAGRTLRPIQTAMQLQHQFTADASHELRTPLAILKTDMEVALRQTNWQVADLHRILRSDLEEVNRLARLAEQLLFLLKREDTSIIEAKQPIDLSEVAQHIVQKLQLIAAHKRITLQLTVADPGSVSGNRSQLEAVLLNLLQNALDYTPSSGRISVQVLAQVGTMQLVVQDSGSGIPQADLPHLFKRFYKADKARNYKVGGAGLGLAIVQAIVQEHQGTITIASVVSQGTTVTVHLPR